MRVDLFFLQYVAYGLLYNVYIYVVVFYFINYLIIKRLRISSQACTYAHTCTYYLYYSDIINNNAYVRELINYNL